MAAAGQLKVLTNLALPAAQTFSALSLLFLPYASRVHREGGLSALKSLTWRIAGLFAAAAIAWLDFLVVLLSRSVLYWLYGGHYAELTTLVPWLAAASLP